MVNFYGSGGITTSRVGNDITITGGGGSMVYPGAGIPLSTGSAWGTSITNNSSNWNTAYGWGNHASAGYLTSQTSHADVVQDGDFASQGIMLRGATSGSYSILTDNSANWNSAYSNMGKVQVEDDFGYGKMSISYFYYSAGMIYPIIASSPSSGEAIPLSSGGTYTALSAKQATLVSGTNIKTVGGTTLLGSGDITLNSGSGTSGRVTYWNGTNSLTSDADFTFDGIDLRVGATNGTGVVRSGDFTLTSDRRLKQGIRPLKNTGWTNKIQFVRYEMKADPSRDRYGVIAQDVEQFAPELVHTDKDGIKSVSYIDLLIAKIAELEKRIKQLEDEK